MARSKAGDTEAFGELVRRYQKPVFRIVLRMVKSPDDADDLTQDTFVRAHRGLKTFKEEFDFHPWLYRIAVNQAINFLNKRKRQAAVDLDDVPEKDIKSGPEPESPIQSASRQELLKNLDAALERLPEEQRTVFLLPRTGRTFLRGDRRNHGDTQGNRNVATSPGPHGSQKIHGDAGVAIGIKE